MAKQSAFSRFMNYFSYEGQCYLTVGIAMIGVSLLGWSFVQKNYESVKAINTQLSLNELQKPLRNLFEHLQLHEVLAFRYLNQDESVIGELTTLNSKIDTDIKTILDEEPELKSVLTDVAHPVFLKEDYFNVKNIQKSWNELQNLTLPQNIYAHNELVMELRNLIQLMGNSSILSQNFSMEMFYNIDMVYSTIPEIQDYITNLTLIGEQLIKSKEKSPHLIQELIAKATLLNDHVHDSVSEIGKIYEMERMNGLNSYVFPVYDQFVSKTEDFIKLIQKNLIDADKIDLNLGDFLTASANTYNASFAYWNSAMDEMNSKLQQKKSEIIQETFKRLLLALCFIGLGFLLSIYLIRWLSYVLKDLDQNIRKFTQGDLNARAQVFFQDQAGRCASAFNSMAAHYETLVKDLKNMLEVIKKLSSGDFSTRLHVTDPQSETGKVAAPFNQMAQTFGEIVGQLRELGITLATSATQITAASKQQELVITEQESTTREISVTANQISTTAQEFANTMNEVSHVAEETAKLASTGKKSLQHMEQIMGQMVEAAQSIASKLAVLNEKASNITSVITTITKVADQTNLLSLNASIEAEKAGEYGKSFAVIAKEIRRLADLTANATLDIEKIVTEIMSAVSTSVIGVDDFTHEIKNGTEEVGQVAEQLNTIMEQVQVLNSNFESINQGMQGQAIGAEQINDAIAQLNLTARETSSSLSGFRQTLQGLTIAAGDLKGAVDRIKKENLMDRLSIETPEEIDEFR